MLCTNREGVYHTVPTVDQELMLVCEIVLIICSSKTFEALKQAHGF